MRRIFGLLLIIVATAPEISAQFSFPHKSEAQIARMTPKQHVEEFCREHARHVFPFHNTYDETLEEYLRKDGPRAFPQVIREIEAYDPTRRTGASEEKFRRYEGAVFILSHFDCRVFRVRAFGDGRRAIDALKLLSEKLRIAHSNSKEDDEYEMKRRYELHLSYIEALEGISIADEAIRDTLKLKYDIRLSDDDLLNFINYLISRNPYYPGWSESKMHKENYRDDRSKWLRIFKTPEPFLQAYLEYKAKKPEPGRPRQE
ncbi:MAG TPA: hypothetical protein VFD58_29115 [Blastocatellia bacterium]|nr:hypothetical protein [Blastocatellia bacterium]